jgi:hypothetical protein
MLVNGPELRFALVISTHAQQTLPMQTGVENRAMREDVARRAWSIAIPVEEGRLLAPEPTCSGDMLVMIRWQYRERGGPTRSTDRTGSAPLSMLIISRPGSSI